MKKTVKRIASAALCGLLMICMSLPSFALSRTDSHTHVDYDDGVRVTCLSTLTLSKGKSKLNLAFEDGVSHLPEEDYSSIAEVTVKLNGASDAYSFVDSPGMAATAEVSLGGYVPTKSIHNYYVFSTNNRVYRKTFS
ncbi:MAG: hypothetical protein II897_05285 [Clostridia bacterium]|nr:hypothetical protein [Clostridia bacterium]